MIKRLLLGLSRLFGRGATAMALAGILALAAVIAGAAAALALASVLTFAIVLGLVLGFVRLGAGVDRSEGLGGKCTGIETGHGCCSDEETCGFIHMIWDFSFCFPILRCRRFAGRAD
jgi:hypothetical protein